MPDKETSLAKDAPIQQAIRESREAVNIRHRTPDPNIRSCHFDSGFIPGGHVEQCPTCGEWYDTPCDCDYDEDSGHP